MLYKHLQLQMTNYFPATSEQPEAKVLADLDFLIKLFADDLFLFYCIFYPFYHY